MSSLRKLAVFARLITSLELVIVGAKLGAASDGDEPMYFSLMVSSAPTLNTSGIASAVDEALKLVHKDATLLPGYSLQYSQVLDSQV